ncbi:hypothetical protein H5159_15145 [Pseudoalteromonas sp. SG43-1]|uniref:hypothetical protein n=1 Tax=Pseudoalteromonas sp. SG43-1 TaxID=2760971 RepID=UPI0016045317|nr:hypothetical protein [Pseudoalteromonas sp. SG43-1]MBB1452381.1 hypothetical protein [Pseudoalteromonas sp. SG43-1]
MSGVLKIIVALFLIALIAVLTIYGNIIGFLIGLGIAIVLNGMFNRWDKKKKSR